MTPKQKIKKHLERFGKTELIDEVWVDEAVWIMGELTKIKKQLKKEGLVHVTQNNYSTKNGYLQTYEALLKSFVAISIKLGMSPKDREKWLAEEKETKNPLIK